MIKSRGLVQIKRSVLFLSWIKQVTERTIPLQVEAKVMNLRREEKRKMIPNTTRVGSRE